MHPTTLVTPTQTIDLNSLTGLDSCSHKKKVILPTQALDERCCSQSESSQHCDPRTLAQPKNGMSPMEPHELIVIPQREAFKYPSKNP